MNERISPHENLIQASWNRDPEGEAIMERINYLKYEYLKKVADKDGGWATLYQDPSDERYWELTYPNSEQNGGGPPRLECISAEDAGAKYNI